MKTFHILFVLGGIFIAPVALKAQQYTYPIDYYRDNPYHVLSLPAHQRQQQQQQELLNSGPRIYDDGTVKVIDNTRRNQTEYERNRSTYGSVSISNARLTPANTRQARAGMHYPYTPYTQTPYRQQTVLALPDDRNCDWVTYFNTYYDGNGWVDYERIVPECQHSDAYESYYRRDPIGRGRYTPNSYNNYDSYQQFDGVQWFNTYGW